MHQTQKISTLSVTFDKPLRKHEIAAFRRRVWEFVGMGNDIFHNHVIQDGRIVGNLERYPLIQFRTYKGMANIWAVNDGVEAVKAALVENPHFLPLSEPLLMQHDYEIAVLPQSERQLYKLFGYVPFDKKNHAEYKRAASMRERLSILERILTNHLVLFAYGVGWMITPEVRLTVEIHDITAMGRAPYTVAKTREVLEYLSFDLSFYVNAVLPDQAGIGNLKGLGYGLLKRWEEINY